MIAAPVQNDKITNITTENAIDVRLSDTQEARRVLLNLLIDKTYTEKVWAIVREYATNAMDANIQAGRPDMPIEIVLPYSGYDNNGLYKKANVFSIRDFGDGLDRNEMEDIFVALGESTKRLSNSQTGMMGIGAKAGFCYGDFRVVSIKDGVKSCYLATRNAERMPTFVPIGKPEKTTEHSGLLIHFEVKDADIQEFRSRTFFLAQFSKVRPKIINDQGYVFQDLTPVLSGDGWSVIKTVRGNYMDELNVVMGNICYACRNNKLVEEMRSVIYYGYSLVIYAAMGEVSFTSSREELEYTDHTVRNIKKYLAGLKKKVQDKIDAEVTGSKNIFEAFRKFRSFSSFFVMNHFNWNGNKYDNGVNFINIFGTALSRRYRKAVKVVEYVQCVDSKTFKPVDTRSENIAHLLINGTAKIVSNLDPKETRKNRWKMLGLPDHTTVFCLNSMPPEYGVLDPEMDWDKVEMVKPPASARRTYTDVYEFDSAEGWQSLEEDEIPDGEKLFVTLETNAGVYLPNFGDSIAGIVKKIGKPVYGIRRTKYSKVVTDSNSKDWKHLSTEIPKHYKWEVVEKPKSGEHYYQIFESIALYLKKSPKFKKMAKDLKDAFTNPSSNSQCPHELCMGFEPTLDNRTVYKKPDPTAIPSSINYDKEIAEIMDDYPWIVECHYWNGEKVARWMEDQAKKMGKEIA